MAAISSEHSPIDRDLGEIENPAFKHDFDLSDRYQNYSAEMLRLALAGIGGLGFLIASVLLNTIPKVANAPTGRVALSVSAPVFSGLAALSLVCLGLSSAASLAHRYLATDSVACHVRALRLILRARPTDADEVKREKRVRNQRFDQSRWSLTLASTLLGLGAILLAFAFVFGLLYG